MAQIREQAQLLKVQLQRLQQPLQENHMILSIYLDNSSKKIFHFRDQFLKKLQACSSPIDLNDDSKHIK